MAQPEFPREDWVPPERRLLGLDRRTFAPAAVVIVLAVVLAWALPRIDAEVPYDDPVREGEALRVAGDVTFYPEPGWMVTAGVRDGHPPASDRYPAHAAVLDEDDDARASLRTGTYNGDARDLLDRIRRTTDGLNDADGFHVVGKVRRLATLAGLEGVMARYSSAETAGLIAAFVIDGVGIEFVTTAPPDADEAIAIPILRMLLSIGAADEPRAPMPDLDDVAQP